ncbi:aminodeoxychorismate/anthranilate synthase component II [Streptococcus hyointestinalis]|uniref:Para-aminobenzoate/anthranilate synthase glutamine amidotransferase component II n=1 Tax=Streptococcus hyointestinalis TaxID=1337 RepID=A0A380K9L3_9STRE|nr:aminodeoxychorismate/anthranilate synthase component II [Streptococcus hyointestinalis]SUN60967.1 para-aminobenzoate/anthranilate synthase glutamine amidotransferase component II [Streptococcus hyointestinalis]
MILLVDNYDSFTFNLMQYLSRFDEVHVLRNDDERLYDVAKKADGIVLSPGPGWPSDAGQMEDLIKDFAGQKPILGICLGHQAIAESFGGKLDLAKQVMHGKQSQMAIEKLSPIFTDVIKETAVMRYHSIVVSQLPEGFEVTARTTDDHEIMAIQNQDLQIYGLQYHPESIGTDEGMKMVENFVTLVKESMG